MKAPQVFTAPVDTTQALLVAGGGAAVVASVDAILETIYAMDMNYWRGKFPFLFVSTRIPPLTDWLLALVPAGIIAVAARTMNPLLAYFGLGGLLWGGGEVLKDLLQRNIPFLVLWLQGTSAQYAQGASRVSKSLSTYA